MKIEVFGFADCPNFGPAVQRVRAVLQQTGTTAVIREINVENDTAAIETGFLGSPTVRINDLDVERAARNSNDFGFGCRTYVVNEKRLGIPPQEWIEAAIREQTRHEDI